MTEAKKRRIPSWLVYTVLRLAFIFVPFWLLSWIGLDWLPAILWATLIGFVLSMVLLRQPRSNTSIAIAASRDRRRGRKSKVQIEEEAIEDARADSLEVNPGLETPH